MIAPVSALAALLLAQAAKPDAPTSVDKAATGLPAVRSSAGTGTPAPPDAADTATDTAVLLPETSAGPAASPASAAVHPAQRKPVKRTRHRHRR